MSNHVAILYSSLDVVLLLVAAMALLVVTTQRLTTSARIRRFRSLLANESGASYILAVALILPFYTLLIGTIVECALIMAVKLGTYHAAYAAARAAIVWQPAEVSPPQRSEMIHLAAAQALAPFASSKTDHLTPTPYAGLRQHPANSAFHAAFERFSNRPSNDSFSYLTNKRLYALAATRVQVELAPIADPADAAWRDVTITVDYEKPIDIPAVGLFLGRRASWPGSRFFSRHIESTVTLSLETPKSANAKLGINYDSWDY